MSLPIENYAMIGDCRSAALVSNRGSIDWLCWPRFDSPACFCALLGDARHGRWSLAPHDTAARVTRRYLDGTLILQTRFETQTGTVLLTDFMPPTHPDTPVSQPPTLVRIVEGLAGHVALQTQLAFRFEYGQRVPWVAHDGDVLTAVAGADGVRLYSTIALELAANAVATADFTVREGEAHTFVLVYQPSYEAAQPPWTAHDAFAHCQGFWREWSARSTYRGDYGAAVQRSLITLKALTYAPSGGLVAAPTTSLPEQLGSTRNWDYRFCWIRDATITLYSLLVAGYTAEAEAWRHWLLRAVAGEPEQIRVLYGIAGERGQSEQELPALPGYANSRPVRIGNAARSQLQLDTFGELLDAMYQCREHGLHNPAGWILEKKLLEHLEHVWMQPDAGIWEIRGPLRHFTHSKAMAWAAFDRAVRSVEQFGLDGPVERWRAVRDQIHADVCTRGFSRALGCFTQSYGSQALDASLLLLPLVGFLAPDDPRVASTVDAIERALLIDDTFVLRYRTAETLDGLPEGEGAFLACSFWLVSNRVMLGRATEARALFERLLSLRNDVGLLSEEYDPHARMQLGNFPQAFSHLALVDAAVSLSNIAQNPAEHRVDPTRTTGRGAAPSTTA